MRSRNHKAEVPGLTARYSPRRVLTKLPGHTWRDSLGKDGRFRVRRFQPMVRHSSDVSRAPRNSVTLASARGHSALCRTWLGILAVLTCGGSANLDGQASDTVPARLISGRDTAAIIVPDTVRRDQAFAVKVTTFAGGCIREAGGNRLTIHGLVADVTLLDVRRVEGNACTDDEIRGQRTISLRFDRAGLGRIRVHGAANRLDFGAQPQWVVIERTVVVR